MQENKTLTVVPLPSNRTVIEYAEDLLARAKAGEVVGITTAEEYQDGEYAIRGSSCSSRTQTAGMLLDAAITRLHFGRDRLQDGDD